MRLPIFSSLIFGLLLSATTGLPAARAQDEAPQKKKFSALLNVDSLIDNYSRFLARKYNLDEEQDAYTQKLLREKAQKFLGQNEGEMFDLIDRMFEVRTGGSMDPNELVEWGKRVAPLYDQAKAIIIDGNNEWRGILNDQQRAMHDADLKLMEDSFRSTDEQIHRIVNGDMSVEEFRNPARYQKQNRQAQNNPPPPQQAQPINPPPPGEHPIEPIPNQPPQKIGDGSETHDPHNDGNGEAPPPPNEKGGEAPPPDQPPPQPAAEQHPQPEGHDAAAVRDQIRKAAANKEGGQARVSKNFESEWEAYVRQFIDKYKLNSEQTQKAQDILKDCQRQADRYMRSRESRFADFDKREAALRTSKDKNASKEIAKINDDRQKLLAPIGDILEKQLKPKLERLPTTKQRKDAETANKKGGLPAPGNKGSKKQTAGPPSPGDNKGKGDAAPPPDAPQPEMPPADTPQDQPVEQPESKGEDNPQPDDGGESPR